MDQLIDNIARELARPTSRRGVMRLIGGALLGGVVAAWKPASLQAQTCNPPCSGSKGTCCTTGEKPFCITTGRICCGNGKCDPKKQCCTTGDKPFCITAGKTCCGNTKCGSNEHCCTTSASPFCAPTGAVCCGTKVCKRDETCCNNSTCCRKGQPCISGRCQASMLPN